MNLKLFRSSDLNVNPRLLVCIVLVIATTSFEKAACYGQSKLDTASMIADAIYTSRVKLDGLISEAVDIDTNKDHPKVVFVKVEGELGLPLVNRRCESGDLLIIFTDEGSLFYFDVLKYLVLDEIELKQRRGGIYFSSQKNFNKAGDYSGCFKLRKVSGKWTFNKLKLN